jgi:hypothetical protein
MIKLKNLLPEISLMSGNAGSDGMEDLYFNVIDKILPQKERILINRWMGRDDYKFDPAERKSKAEESKIKAEQEQAKQLMLVSDDFKAKVNSKFPLITRSGGYELHLQKSGKELIFHLVDPNAKYVYEYFIGIIKTENQIRNFKYDPKKAFNLSVYQIHWSNVAQEHMGKGLGKLMYTLVYQYVTGLGAGLVSDTMLFEGSQKMWFDFIPSIASFFGVVVENVFFPIDRAEVKRDIMGGVVDTVVAMENPPADIRKIAYNMKGLSFTKGQYGAIRVYHGINDKISLKVGQTTRTFTFIDKDDRWQSKPNKDFQYTLFSNMVDEAPNMISLLKKMEVLDVVDSFRAKNGTESHYDLKACVFGFNNANVIVKETGGGLVMVTI